MALRTTSGDRGSTLLALLIVLTITGVALSVVAQSWTTRIRREKEEELLFRGSQIRAALSDYRKMTPAGQPTRPQRLEDLLVDPRFPVRVRHLRKAYLDPMTRQPFVLIRDAAGGIRGVQSADPRPPLKRSSFPPGMESFAAARSYADWNFVD